MVENIRNTVRYEYGIGRIYVMPNHFHAIILIVKNKFNAQNIVNGGNVGYGRDAMHGVSTTHTATNKFGPQSKNVGYIIRGLKSSVTTFARKNNCEFEGQQRFHDHIIRDHDEYIRISNYIANNPANWKENKLNN